MIDYLNALVTSVSPRYFLYLILLAFCSLVGLLKWGNIQKDFRPLVFYVSIILISEITGKYLAFTQNNSMVVYHFLVPIQMLFYGLMYWSFVENKIRPLVCILTFIALFTSIFLTLNYIGLNSFPNLQITMLTLQVVPLVLFSFKHLLAKIQTVGLHNNPLFWFNVGNLIFFSVTFFVFGFYNTPYFIPEWAYVIIWVSNMLLYGCYLACLFLTKLKPNV